MSDTMLVHYVYILGHLEHYCLVEKYRFKGMTMLLGVSGVATANTNTMHAKDKAIEQNIENKQDSQHLCDA